MNATGPPKAKRAPAKSALPKLGLVDASPIVCGAQHGCAHLITRFSIQPAGSVHFAAEKCAHCGCLVRWVPKPANVERQRNNAFRIAKLSMQEGLSRWERAFLESIAHQPRLSPRQQEVLDKLVAKFLGGKIS